MKKPLSNRTLYFIAPIIFLVTAVITLIRGEVSISMTFLSIGIIFLIIALYEGKGDKKHSADNEDQSEPEDGESDDNISTE